MAVTTLVVLWNLRLGKHLWDRVSEHHPQVDPRYEILKKRWGENEGRVVNDN